MNNKKRYRIEAVDGTRNEVLHLFCEGHSYSFIATATGLSENKVKAVISYEFKENYKERQGMIERTAMQLDHLVKNALNRYYDSNCADIKSADLALKAIDQRKKLFGLDEATKVHVTHSIDTMSLEEINAELEKYGVVRELPEHKPDDTIEVEFEVKQHAIPKTDSPSTE